MERDKAGKSFKSSVLCDSNAAVGTAGGALRARVPVGNFHEFHDSHISLRHCSETKFLIGLRY